MPAWVEREGRPEGEHDSEGRAVLQRPGLAGWGCPRGQRRLAPSQMEWNFLQWNSDLLRAWEPSLPSSISLLEGRCLPNTCPTTGLRKQRKIYS